MTRSLKSQILIYIVLQLCNVTFLHAPTFNFWAEGNAYNNSVNF